MEWWVISHDTLTSSPITHHSRQHSPRYRHVPQRPTMANASRECNTRVPRQPQFDGRTCRNPAQLALAGRHQRNRMGLRDDGLVYGNTNLTGPGVGAIHIATDVLW